MDFSFVNDDTLLKIAVKAENNTIGENDLVPSRVVFGIISRLSIIATELPKQKEQMKIIAKVQMDMNAIIARRRTLSALNGKISYYADHIFRICEKALAFLKNHNY